MAQQAMTFNQSFWGEQDLGFEVLMDRMKSSKHICVELLSIFQQRADIEDDYAKKLLKLSKSATLAALIKQDMEDTHPHGISTLTASFDSMRNELEQHSKSRSTLAEELRTKCLKPLDAFTNQQRESRKEHQNAVEKSLKSKTTLAASVQKLEEKFRQRSAEVEGLQAQRQSTASRPKELEKLEGKIQKATQALKQSDNEYLQACDKLRDIHQIWMKDFYAACDEFQRLEELRIDFMRSNLWAYANANSTACVNDDAAYERLRTVLEKCNIEQDIVLFIKSKGTGDLIPAPVEYHATASASLAPRPVSMKASVFSQTQSTPTSGSARNIGDDNHSRASSVNPAKVAANAVSQQPGFNPFHEDVMDSQPSQALPPYTGVNATVISKTQGFNPFFDSTNDDANQSPPPQAQSNGNPFHEDLMDLKQPTAPSVTNNVPQNSQLNPSKVSGASWRAKVLYNYDAANHDELTVDSGQFVQILGAPEANWLYGELTIGKNKVYGMIPGNIVERV